LIGWTGASAHAIVCRPAGQRRPGSAAPLGQRHADPAALVRRARILLLAAEGVANTEIAERLGTSRPTAVAWRRRHSEFLSFLKQVAGAYPRRQLHVVCDNYATHKHARVRAWLVAHSRVHLHFTPTYASWLNLVEVFFSILERQALRCAAATSPASRASWRRSAGLSLVGTSAASRLCGPRTPSRS
jgi:transposase/DNA-binding CsgD family transcriptional regulator